MNQEPEIQLSENARRALQRQQFNRVGLRGANRKISIFTRARFFFRNLFGIHEDPLAIQRRGYATGLDRRVMRVAFGYLHAHDCIHLSPVVEDGKVKAVVYDLASLFKPFDKLKNIRRDPLSGAKIKRAEGNKE